MKLASLAGGRDGRLVVVSRDLSLAVRVGSIAPTLQSALDDWEASAPAMAELAKRLEAGQVDEAFPLRTEDLAAPLPRAYQWLDASAYLSHVERVRHARGAELPPSLREDPLMYQGVSDSLLGPRDPIACASEADGIDLEGEVAVVIGDVPAGVTPDDASTHIRLVTLCNDVSLRNRIPAELGKGFGFVQGKPPSAFGPVAVTPDELGGAWDGARLHLPLRAWRGDLELGAPDAGRDMAFGFDELIAHAAATRPLGAGTLIGSGTVSNADASRGVCCLAELRTLEVLEQGEAVTPFLSFGERIGLEMRDAKGQSIFGAIEQEVVPR